MIPEAWQSGWQGIVFGLCVMGGAAAMFELGHWAGAIEEREYWAPLEDRPKRLWWRGWRWLELHVIDRVKGRRRPARRAKDPLAVVSGRHRQDMTKAPQSED
jgi:hypothetical protein